MCRAAGFMMGESVVTVTTWLPNVKRRFPHLIAARAA
jgi:hypothetical protein